MTRTINGNSLRRLAAWSALVLIIFACLAILLTYPLVTNLSHYYFNPTTPHDGVGTIAAAWYSNYARQHGGFGARTTFWGFPFGSDLHNLSLPLSAGVLNALTRAFGAQTGFNFLIILSFPLAGLLMFWLVNYITGSMAASFLSGFIYAFSPWHTARTFNQLSLSMIYVLPLFLLAVIYFWRRRTVLSALGVAGALVVAICTDYHFGLFCGLILVAWGLAALVNGRVETGRSLHRERTGVDRQTLRVLLLGVLAIVLALAITAPVLQNLFYKDPSVISTSGERSIDTTVSYSSRFWNYVVPPAHALVWRSWTTDYVFKHENNAGSHEMTAYPGIVTYALAFIALFFTFKRRRRPSAESGEDEEADPGPDSGADAPENDARASRMRVVRTAVYFGLIAGVMAFILSLPPIWTVGGVRIPTPSIIMRAFAPFFRFYARWALVVTFALSLLAGIGFFLLRDRWQWSKGKTVAICLVLVALFALDVTIVPPLRASDITKVPRAVTDLARYPKDQPVAYYPMAGQYFIPLQYQYYQMFNEHPMLNGSKVGTIGDYYQGVLKDVYAPYTPQMLSGLGVKKVVVVPGLYKRMLPVGIDFDPAKMPPGYRLLDKAPDSYIYDVTAPPAHVFPLYYTNFSGSVILEDGQAWNALLKPSGQFLIQNKGQGGNQLFSIEINNPGSTGTLSMDLDGSALGSTRIAGGFATVKVPMRIDKKEQTLTIRWDGQPMKTSGKTVGINGDIQVYMFLSRPQFTAAGV